MDGRLALVTSVWPSEEMGSGPERNRDREGDSGNRGAGECLEVEDAQACGGTEGMSEEDLEGLRESIIGIP